jgi:PIN domain nuclease of toxin-antitoxin system
MLVAQARLEGLTLATADPKIKRYDVPVLDVTPG